MNRTADAPAPSSPAKRPRRERETPEIAAGLRRQVAALGERIGGEDPVDLLELDALEAAIRAARARAVELQRGNGFSWREIGEGLGISRTAACDRFGK